MKETRIMRGSGYGRRLWNDPDETAAHRQDLNQEFKISSSRK